jgi:hypothetical protein
MSLSTEFQPPVVNEQTEVSVGSRNGPVRIESKSKKLLTVTKSDVEPGGSSGPLETRLEDVGLLGLGDGSGVDHGQRGEDGDDGDLGESEHCVM